MKQVWEKQHDKEKIMSNQLNMTFRSRFLGIITMMLLTILPIGTIQAQGPTKMYWTDSYTHKIQRAELDGNNVEDLLTAGIEDPLSRSFDLQHSQL